jgi:formylglycine-generating enzyme required for sulfatase activity
MVWVPAGEFGMGRTRRLPPGLREGADDPSAGGQVGDNPSRRVYVSGFWVDACEVTNARFRRFVEATDYRTDAEKSGDTWAVDGLVKGLAWAQPRGPGVLVPDWEDLPVVLVSWGDAVQFSRWARLDLPSEAEWEKAARAGLEGRAYPWGDQPPLGLAAFGARGRGRGPEPVGSHEPNAWGIHDMAGNVSEWCLDTFARDDPLAGDLLLASARDPIVSTEGATWRVRRGGGWSDREHTLECGARLGDHAHGKTTYVGFRCVKRQARR